MAAESGHHSNRVYRDQAGNIHLNGGTIYNRNEQGQEIFGGTAKASSAGLAAITVTGSSGFRAVTANLKSSAVPSTVAGVADQVSVAFASNSSAIDLYFTKPTSSAVPERIAATSTNNEASWMAIGF